MHSHKQTACILSALLFMAHINPMHAMFHDKKEVLKWGAITGGIVLFGTAMYQLGKRSGTIDKQNFDSKQFMIMQKKWQQGSTNTARPYKHLQEDTEKQNTDDSAYADYGRKMQQLCNDNAPDDQKQIWNTLDNLTDTLNAQYAFISNWFAISQANIKFKQNAMKIAEEMVKLGGDLDKKNEIK